MPVVSTAKMTAQQFLMLGDDPPGIRLELVNGEVAVSPSPRPRHSHVDRSLTAILFTYVRDNDLGILLGDTDTIFGEHDVRRPDLIYFTKARAHLVDEDEAIDGPPDLCIEIVSPTSGRIDRKDKFQQYADGKVRYYWIIDPKLRTAEAFTLKGKDYVPSGRGQCVDVVSFPPFLKLDIPLSQLWFPAKGRRR